MFERSRRRNGALVLVGLLATGDSAWAADKLVRLIPNLYGQAGLIVESEAVLPTGQTHSAHFNSAFQAGFSQLNVALASQIASVPLPSPASGYTYRFDPESGVFARSTQSFGPILSDRSETLGKHKLSLGFSHQRFTFDTLEGSDLRRIEAVFTHDNPAPGGRDDVITTVNAIDVSVDQTTAFLTYGLSDRLDLSLALPVVTTDLGVTSDATVQRIGTSANPRVHFFGRPGEYGDTQRFRESGSSTGIGDVLVRLKATAIKRRKTGLAVGADVRLPTGDEEDLLGSGALGVRPFLVFSTVGAIAPHVNVGYQWNGNSMLAGNLTTAKAKLPQQFTSATGVDFNLGKRVTVAVDLLARRVLDSPRLRKVTFRALDDRSSFPDIKFDTGSFNTLDGSVGVKWNPVGKLLLDINVLFKLNQGGLRDKLTPLLGIEYGFN